MNPGKWLRSSSFRLALIYMALFGGSVLILLTFIYWSTARYMTQQADVTIEAGIAGLAERYRTSGLGGLTKTISERISRKPGGYSIYLIADDDLRPLVGNISRRPPGRATQDGWLDFRLEGEGWPAGEIHRARAHAFQLHGGFRLLVGRDLHELERTEQLIVRTLIWGLAITLILGLIGGSMMTRSLVRRIETVNQTSREIMSGDLSRRIPMDRSGDDFDELAGNLNAMLDRIASLMEEVRRISDNIAHDLKTPLSRLKNSLELLGTSRADDPQSRRMLIEQSIAEADGLLSTFNALLRIARIGIGRTARRLRCGGSATAAARRGGILCATRRGQTTKSGTECERCRSGAWRSRSAVPGLRQPAGQCDQIHPAARLYQGRSFRTE